MLKEFREFIAKGNMLDLAIGIVIGAAFTAIVGSLVKDIVNPLIGLFGKANFDNMFWVLREGDPSQKHDTPALAQAAGYVTLNYGAFLTAVMNFLIVAFVLFLVVKAANRLKRKQEEAPPVVEVSNEERLLIEIRDLLARKA